jgi:aldehyde:ferredoxin oxidoreductase
MLHTRGPLLTVDVGRRETETTDVDDVLAEFVGGRGVATKLATERIPTDADPFGPENSLFLSTGPLQASRMSFTGRMNCTGLSPLTNGLLSSNAGGFLSRNFVGAGNAVVELAGASDELVVVHVREDGVTVEAVPDLAGAEVPEVTAFLSREHDLAAEHVACVGPAGENRVRFASIMTSESRAFGRGGLGAVMGAKNVKAVTFDGDADPGVTVPDVASEVHRDAATSDSIMKRQGTTSVTDLSNEVGAFPAFYFRDTSYERADSINGAAVEEKKYKRGTCSQCAFACKLPTRDEASGLETEGPEFETVMAFGGNCDVDDVVDVMRSNELCDRYGLDTISCGDTVAAYLASEDEFGNAELVHETVRKIARREGVGDLLAEGVDRAHAELGVENWSVKGMEFPAHDGRTLHGQGLGFATANRGADHMYATFYAYEYPLVDKAEAFDNEGFTPEKVRELVRQENKRAFEDVGIACRFSRSILTDERYEALFDADFEDLLAVGAAVIELERAFNNARGFDRSDDRLPYELEGFDDALDTYYDERGWSRDGVAATSLGGPSSAPADD